MSWTNFLFYNITWKHYSWTMEETVTLVFSNNYIIHFGLFHIYPEGGDWMVPYTTIGRDWITSASGHPWLPLSRALDFEVVWPISRKDAVHGKNEKKNKIMISLECIVSFGNLGVWNTNCHGFIITNVNNNIIIKPCTVT